LSEDETSLQFIEMGARIYLPVLGRFLQQDPVDGGSCSDYDYVCADPVNRFDIGGTCICIGKRLKAAAARVATRVYAVLKKGVSFAADVKDAAQARASALGRNLRKGTAAIRSEAGKALRSAGRLAKSPILRIAKPLSYVLDAVEVVASAAHGKWKQAAVTVAKVGASALIGVGIGFIAAGCAATIVCGVLAVAAVTVWSMNSDKLIDIAADKWGWNK
jgi:RHS repeat-associated protein